MKNKRGFTLIELLAVIAVLSIILVIVTPQVIKSINNSRNEAFYDSYKNIISEVQKRIIEKKSNSSIEIRCSDFQDEIIEEKEENLKFDITKYGACSTKYDLSSFDYIMNVILDGEYYFVIVEGRGKFKNIEFTQDKKLTNKHIYTLDYKQKENPKSLFTVISKNGKVISLDSIDN